MGRDLRQPAAVLRPPPSDLAPSSEDPSRKLWGILTRKERWGLSWRGRLLFTSGILVAGYLGLSMIHPFLALTDRVNSKILLVEGWIPRYALRASADEFNRGPYERIFTTGGPDSGSGGYVNDYQTSASEGAEALKEAGVPEDVVQTVPSHVIGRDRTYSSAVAFRDWLREHSVTIRSINVLTEDAHARRTRLLYQKALGKNVIVGIISVPNPDYDPKLWWRYSDGVREVIGESIAYIYARLFFYPSGSSRDEKAAP
jgi:uncharacterized SAM-binding protein YcdF (DUF218 family)